MGKQPGISTQVLEAYEELVATIPKLERKGATMPYTSVNGNKFSFLNGEGVLALRLGAEEREAFIKKYKTGLMEAHGTVMKEYVAVPAKLQKNTKELAPYFAQSFAYTKSLKPKKK